VLGDLYESLTKTVFENCPLIVFGREFDSYMTGTAHEAGFDAYLTGVCFLRIFGKNQEMKKSGVVEIETKYENRIFLMGSCMDYFSLTQEDILDYSHIFKLSDFPVVWKLGDIQQTFKELGPFHVKWIDDQSCLMVLKRESISLALALCKKKKTRPYKLEPLGEGVKKRKRQDSEEVELPLQKKSKCVIQ
jgi:hypothetical protein